jgi:hypothetical protein
MIDYPSRRVRPLLLAGLFAVGIALSVSLAYGQTATGTLSGIVTDESGAAMAAVELTLVNVDTSVSRRTTADGQGRFTFLFVAPGRYALRAQHDGFAPTQVPSVEVNVGDALDIRITLKVGSLTDSVTVLAATPTRLNTSMSALVDGGRLADLPLESRDFQRLMLIAPGMATAGPRGSLFNPSVSGTRNTSNNFTLDGMSLNEEDSGAVGLGPGQHPGFSSQSVPNVISTEALQEFAVIASNADASYGRGAGAQVSVVTKSGTNTLSGSIYEYFRDSRLDARDFFNRGPYVDDHGNPVPPPLRYNLFGATAGGPIARDRHFFFASYEGFRQTEDLIANQTLPNAELMGLVPGDLGRLFRMSFLDTGFIPAIGNPTGEFRPFPVGDRTAATNAGFPAALFDGDPANGEAGVVLGPVAQPREYVQDAVLIRTDHRLNDRLMLAARYARTRSTFERQFGRPGAHSVIDRDLDSGLAQFLATLSPTQLLEARGGWLRTDSPNCSPDELPEFTELGVGQRGLFFNVAGTTAFSLPSVGTPCTFLQTETVPQVGLTHTWTLRRFTLRSGLDIRDVRNDFANFGLGTPTYQFTGLVGPMGLLGSSPAQPEAVATVFSATIFGAEVSPDTQRRTYQSLQQEYFSQLDWRGWSRVTANLGVRYTVFGVYDYEGASNLYAVDPSTGSVVPDVAPMAFGPSANRVEPAAEGRPLYQPDWNNIQPRIGVAWDVTGHGGTLVKGAYGIYHDRFFRFGFANVLINPPGAVAGSRANVPFTLGPLMPESIDPAAPTLFGVDPSIRNPYFHRTTIGVDQRLGRGTSVFAAYVGTFGRDLARTVALNFGPGFPQAARPDPRFSEVRLFTNVSTSRYDALQVQLRSRPASWLNATASYTYSRYGDFLFPDTIGLTTQTPMMLTNTGASATSGFQIGPFVERPVDAWEGRSDQDLPHVLAISHLIDIPFGRGRIWGAEAPGVVDALLGGWSLAGFLHARSGQNVNLTLGSDVDDDGYFLDRPAMLRGSLDELYSTSGSRTQYLVPQAEALTRLGAPADVTDPFAQVSYNALRSPAVWKYDVSLRKELPIRGARLAVELNAFNVFNHTNLGAPNATLTSALFGTITNTAVGMGPRQLQLGAKLTF